MEANQEGGSISRPPKLDGSNYPYWKACMIAFLKSVDSRTWKSVSVDGHHPLLSLLKEKSRLSNLKSTGSLQRMNWH
ncbi:hypothetical protein LIER_18694 [Lithospermum erythrorhizon]|uniref:Gag-pol polyprotein n=1 Tax=Lithospermum erythrorhizon TaxID=34254 RepID=A0AAV3QEZ2_LITER